MHFCGTLRHGNIGKDLKISVICFLLFALELFRIPDYARRDFTFTLRFFSFAVFKAFCFAMNGEYERKRVNLGVFG